MPKKFLTVLTLVFTAAVAYSQTTYQGTGGSFGGPVGNGQLVLTNNGTLLTGTINAGTGGNSILYDDLVIYIDSKAGGFNNTSTLTDTGGGGDTLRKAISGFDGGTRSTLTFAPTFAADYAIGLSPVQGQFGALFTLDNTGNYTYGTNGSNGNAGLTPTGYPGGNPAAGPYTFSFDLANLGIAVGDSFSFSTTYLNAHSGLYRSDEAFGNSITFTSGNNATAGFSTYTVVPEPGTVVGALFLVGAVCWREKERVVFLWKKFKPAFR